MERRDFIERLFDNGYGLTLSQINTIETEYIPNMIDSGMLIDIKKAITRDDYTPSDDEIWQIAMNSARDCFMDNIHDLGDLLELRDYLIALEVGDITDSQVHSLWYAIGGC